MDKLSQFKALLNSKIEDADLKNELVGAFENVATDVTAQFDDLKSQRKEVGKKLDSEKANFSKLAQSLGLDKDATIEDINEALENRTPNDDIDTKIQSVEAKYKQQLEELRSVVSEKENAYNEVSSKYQDLEFNSLIEGAGVLSGVQDNPVMRKSIVEHLKSQLLVKDGRLFVNDGNGEVARNLTTNEIMTPDVVVSKLKDDKVWQPFFKSDQKAEGMGVLPNQANSGIYSQQTRSSLSKIVDGLKAK